MTQTDTIVFVVDDDHFVRDASRILLKSVGYRVEVFDSARAFLQSGSQRKRGLLLLDVRMPGMSGLEMQAYLTENGIDIPIVFITAHEDKQVRDMAMAAGAVGFLQKPFEDHDLMKAISQANELLR